MFGFKVWLDGFLASEQGQGGRMITKKTLRKKEGREGRKGIFDAYLVVLLAVIDW